MCPVGNGKNMNLNLPAEANAFVKGLVAQGKYQNEEDAVVEGIRLLMGREKLRNEILISLARTRCLAHSRSQ